jgi:hypothetical protein
MSSYFTPNRTKMLIAINQALSSLYVTRGDNAEGFENLGKKWNRLSVLKIMVEDDPAELYVSAPDFELFSKYYKQSS